jgi:hypothetical protein
MLRGRLVLMRMKKRRLGEGGQHHHVQQNGQRPHCHQLISQTEGKVLASGPSPDSIG